MSVEPPSVADDAATMLRDLLALDASADELAMLDTAEPLWRRIEQLAAEVVQEYDRRRAG